MSRRGHDRERDVVRLLEADGWVAVRVSGSGAQRRRKNELDPCHPIDVVALASAQAVHPVFGLMVDPANLRVRDHATMLGWRDLLIEVKSTDGGPWERFGPEDRAKLSEAARRAGAAAWLAWWPPHAGSPTWIAEPDWPKPGRTSRRTRQPRKRAVRKETV